MADIYIKNIKILAGVDNGKRLLARGKEMSEFGQINNAWLLVKKDKIAARALWSVRPKRLFLKEPTV